MPGTPATTTTAPTDDGRRLLGIAVVAAVVFHGGTSLAGSWRGTYDAFVHLFFADHYARDWFSTWEPRWYTGFTTVSYPPGTHQALALLSKVTSPGAAFVLLQTAVVVALVAGAYRYARLWVSPRAAGFAAVVAALSPMLAEVVHVFGQLPTTAALAALLNACPSADAWVRRGRLRDLFVAVTTLAAVTAVHHVTTLFGSAFVLGPVCVAAALDASRVRLPDEVGATTPPIQPSTIVPLAARRIRRALPTLVRVGVLGGLTLVSLVAVVLPYWLWSASDPITQVPIPHGSRADFLADLDLGLVFFLVPWGTGLFALAYGVLRGTLDGRWPLVLSLVTAAGLGTGGTTPIPRLLLGPAYEVLTLDRFTVWAVALSWPFAGQLVESFVDGSVGRWLRNTGGRALLAGTGAVAVSTTVGWTLFAANLGELRPMQPRQIDPAPIVDFMAKDDHDRWRYLLLGFGDQVAWVSAQTSAETVDGNYHSARRLPELTGFSVERLEGAKYRGVPGLGSLQQFLVEPGPFSLKYVFVEDRFYDPLLALTGWRSLGPLENGVHLWERLDVPPLPAIRPVVEPPSWQRLLWGVLPPTAMLTALLVQLWRVAHFPGADAAARLLPTPRSRRLAWFLGLPDRLLARVAGRLPDVDRRRRDRTRTLRRLQALLRARVGRRARIVRLVGVALLLSTVAALVMWRQAPEVGPAEVVAAYHEDLDLRRFEAAWERLDPRSRSDYATYRRDRSLEGGLVASYSSLADVTTRVRSQNESGAIVVAELRYLTSVSVHHVTAIHELVRRDGRWYLDPPAAPEEPVGDALVSRSGQEVLIRSGGPTADDRLASLQARPRVEVVDARLVDVDGRPVVVGRAMNTDPTPADVTVTARFLAADGSLLAEHPAGTVFLQSLRPGESSGFRIDLEGSGALLGGPDLFDPEEFQPPGIELDDVAVVEVQARGVATGRGLTRDLQVVEVRSLTDQDGADLIGLRVRNDGTAEAALPHLVLSWNDDDGTGWVDDVVLDASLRPQADRWITIPVPPRPEAAGVVVTTDVETSPSIESFEVSGAIGSWSGLRVEAHAPEIGR